MIDNFATIMVAVAPAITAVIGIVIGVIRIARMLKSTVKNIEEESKKYNLKQNKSYDDIAILKAKLASIEKYLTDESRRK